MALLDQLATFGSGKIADEDASHLLGGLDTALFQRLIGAILDGEPAQVHQLVGEIEEKGWDPQHVFGQFLLFTRDGLHLALGAGVASVDLAAEDAEALARRVKPAGYERLLQVLNLLLQSEAGIRRSEFGLLALEIAWLRAAELPKVVRIEELLASGEGRGGARPPVEVRDSYRPPALKMSAPDLELEPPLTRSAEAFPAAASRPPLVSEKRPASPETPPTRPTSAAPLDALLDSIGNRRARRAEGEVAPARVAENSAVALPYDLENQPAVRTVLQLFGGRIQKVRAENDDEETPA